SGRIGRERRPLFANQLKDLGCHGRQLLRIEEIPVERPFPDRGLVITRGAWVLPEAARIAAWEHYDHRAIVGKGDPTPGLQKTREVLQSTAVMLHAEDVGGRDDSRQESGINGGIAGYAGSYGQGTVGVVPSCGKDRNGIADQRSRFGG